MRRRKAWGRGERGGAAAAAVAANAAYCLLKQCKKVLCKCWLCPSVVTWHSNKTKKKGRRKQKQQNLWLPGNRICTHTWWDRKRVTEISFAYLSCANIYTSYIYIYSKQTCFTKIYSHCNQNANNGSSFRATEGNTECGTLHNLQVLCLPLLTLQPTLSLTHSRPRRPNLRVIFHLKFNLAQRCVCAIRKTFQTTFFSAESRLINATKIDKQLQRIENRLRFVRCFFFFLWFFFYFFFGFMTESRYVKFFEFIVYVFRLCVCVVSRR